MPQANGQASDQPSALSCFTLSINNHIAHLVLNKPKALNTMHPTFWRELDGVLTRLHRGTDARVLVISSTGKHFSAGMSLETFSAGQENASSGHSDPDATGLMNDQTPEGRAAVFDTLQDIQSTFTKIEALRIPVIAAIQGGCIGGAVDMVTACCIRYATVDAFFCIQEINIGLVADVGTLQRLPKLIPLGVVKELAYTGRRLGAARALGYGLVNEVFDTQDAMLAAAMQCAAEIASKPPVAIWGTKQVVHYARWVQGAIWSNAHVGEAVAAMKDKRPGNYPPLAALRRFTGL